MKKTIVIILIAFVGIAFSGCTNSKDTARDINGFIMGYGLAYCKMRSVLDDFWNDYYSEQFTDIRMKDGTDIPTMNTLGKKGLNNIKIYGIDEEIKLLNSSALSGNFGESLRLLNLSRTFLGEYLAGSSKLINFNQFQATVSVGMMSFNETLESIPATLKTEFDFLATKLPKEDAEGAGMFLNIEEICPTKMSVKK